MFKIASNVIAIAALATVSTLAVPAGAAVQIQSSIELELPDFMPDLTNGVVFVLSDSAEWPVAAAKEQPAS